LGSIAHQAYFLIQELERVTDEEFSREACVIKEVLICCAEQVVAELKKLGAVSGEQEWQFPDKTLTSLHIRHLGILIQELYSSLEELLASSPRQTPPGLQSALNQLTEAFLPTARRPICVVRAHWQYQLTCRPLSEQMKETFSSFLLDPQGTVGTLGDIISSRWALRRKRLQDGDVIGNEPPETFAILSFPRLNTNNTLYYPLLAHELAHFIEHSVPLPFDEDLLISREAVQAVLNNYKTTSPLEELHDQMMTLEQEAQTCISELLADLIAVRMMGVSFFFSQAEFLNSLSLWSITSITDGFPPARFRLWVILKHLLTSHPQDPLKFLQAHQTQQPEARRLIELSINTPEHWK